MAAQSTTKPHKLNIAIVGAGIAGLTLAIAPKSYLLINIIFCEKATEE
jgi:salicylate hydroxylase